ncbi:unnamed protein product [Arabidopsis lyrata]|nr:unnamed protein product [Arabidopsis lyrata]
MISMEFRLGEVRCSFGRCFSGLARPCREWSVWIRELSLLLMSDCSSFVEKALVSLA